MGLFEQRPFLLNNSTEVMLFKWIPDCLGYDMIGNCIVNEAGSLDSIIKFPNSDLENKRLLVTRREFGRMASFVVFFVCLHLLVDPANG